MKAEEWINQEQTRISKDPVAYADLMGRKLESETFVKSLPQSQQLLVGAIGALLMLPEGLPTEVSRELIMKALTVFMEYLPSETMENAYKYLRLLTDSGGSVDAPQG